MSRVGRIRASRSRYDTPHHQRKIHHMHTNHQGTHIKAQDIGERGHTEPRPTVIVGATAPEVVKLIHAITQCGKERYSVVGFLDDDPVLHGSRFMGYNILGPTTLLSTTYRDCWVVNNVARTTAVREKVWHKLEQLGVSRFLSLVHPSVDINGVTVGAGAIIQEGCIIGPMVEIGAQSLISFGCVVAHECVIGRLAALSPKTIINGRARVEDKAFLGAGCIILPNMTVGESSIVGAGSVVTKDVPAHSTVFGNPARVIQHHANGAGT